MSYSFSWGQVAIKVATTETETIMNNAIVEALTMVKNGLNLFDEIGRENFFKSSEICEEVKTCIYDLRYDLHGVLARISAPSSAKKVSKHNKDYCEVRTEFEILNGLKNVVEVVPPSETTGSYYILIHYHSDNYNTHYYYFELMRKVLSLKMITPYAEGVTYFYDGDTDEDEEASFIIFKGGNVVSNTAAWEEV